MTVDEPTKRYPDEEVPSTRHLPDTHWSRARAAPDDAASDSVGSRMTSRLLGISGVSLDELRSQGQVATSDVARYKAMGFSVCVTSAFSFFAIIAALTLATGHLSWPYLAVGVLWALFIFNLDRWVVSSVTYRSDVVGHLQNAGLMLIRLAISILIGLSISEPVGMLIFSTEIGAAMRDAQDLDARQATERLQADPRFDPNLTPEAQRLTAAREARDAAAGASADANRKLDDELNGTGGSRVAGEGPRTAQRSQDRNTATTALANSEQSFSEAQGAFDRRVAQLGAQRDKEVTDTVGRIESRVPGLIDREAALKTLADRDPVVFSTQWLVRGLILLVDLSPVLLKFASPASLYETRRKLQAGVALDALRLDLAEDKLVATHVRSLTSASRKYGADQAATVRDERITRHSDLDLRRAVADHLRTIQQEGHDGVEDPGVVEHVPRNPYRPRAGDTDKTPVGGDAGRSPDEVTFDHAPRRNAHGKPGEGAAQDVGGRWRLGTPLTSASGAEAWRAAFVAEDILDRSPKKKFYVVKRVAPPVSPGDNPPPLNELHSLPSKGEEVSPFVAPLVQAGYDPEFGYYTVAPYYANGTLQQLLTSAESTLTLAMALTYTNQILQGLLAVFEKLLVLHNDVKPSNVALDDRNVRIIDWGLANSEDMGAKNLGYSLWYAPPEQVRSVDAGTARTSPLYDVRAVGATLYCLVTGAPPLFLEAQAAGFLDARGNLRRDKEEDFKAMLSTTHPLSLRTFCEANPAMWDTESVSVLSDLLARWLDPTPDHRVGRTPTFAQKVALGELRAVIQTLSTDSPECLNNEVGRSAFPRKPRFRPGGIADPPPSGSSGPSSGENTFVPNSESGS